MSRHSYTILWWLACAAVLAPVLWVAAYGLNRAHMSGSGMGLDEWILSFGLPLLLISAGIWMSTGRRRGLVTAAIGIGLSGAFLAGTIILVPPMAVQLGAGAVLGPAACLLGLKQETRTAFH